MTNEEKAREIELNVYAFEKPKGEFEAPAYRAALDMAEWKDQQYQPLVKTCQDLISALQTSRAYHLGITGLDSHEEIERKEREGETALIRSIDSTIKYANEIISELFGGE